MALPQDFLERARGRTQRIDALQEEQYELNCRAELLSNELHTGRISDARHWEIVSALGDIGDERHRLWKADRAIRDEARADRVAIGLEQE